MKKKIFCNSSIEPTNLQKIPLEFYYGPFEGEDQKFAGYLIEVKEEGDLDQFINVSPNDHKAFIFRSGLTPLYSYEKLVKEYHASEVLEKPTSSELEALFKKWFVPEAFSTPDIPVVLYERYRSRIPKMIDEVNALIATALSDPTKENLSALQKVVHKIAGSAGAFGFAPITEICKALDIYLIEQIEGVISQNELRIELVKFLRKFKLFFQNIYSER